MAKLSTFSRKERIFGGGVNTEFSLSSTDRGFINLCALRKGSKYLEMINNHPLSIDEKTNSMSDGRFRTLYNGVAFDCMFAKKQSDKMVVLLSAGIVNTKHIPGFQRWSYSGLLSENVLCIADPMYIKYQSDNLLVGWYYGDENENYLDYVVELVKKVARINKIRHKNIIFYGSSAGGYAGIYCSSKIVGSTVIAWNPQFDLKRHNYIKLFEEIVGFSVAHDKYGRDNITDKVLNNSTSKIVLMENLKSRQDVDQMKVLLGKDYILEYGMNALNANTLLITYEAGDENKAHGLTDRRWIVEKLIDLAEFDWNHIDQYKADYLCLVEALNDVWSK